MIVDGYSLLLNQCDYIEVRIPSIPKYSPDEVEIWLVNSHSAQCIFKDSYKYVFSVEASHVIDCFRQRNQKNHYISTELVERYIHHCNPGPTDRALWDYELFAFEKTIVFLSEVPSGDAIIQIVELNPFADVPTQRDLGCYCISRSKFLQWSDKLLSEQFKILVQNRKS